MNTGELMRVLCELPRTYTVRTRSARSTMVGNQHSDLSWLPPIKRVIVYEETKTIMLITE